jgi:hypothetical protein
MLAYRNSTGDPAHRENIMEAKRRDEHIETCDKVWRVLNRAWLHAREGLDRALDQAPTVEPTRQQFLLAMTRQERQRKQALEDFTRNYVRWRNYLDRGQSGAGSPSLDQAPLQRRSPPE